MPPDCPGNRTGLAVPRQICAQDCVLQQPTRLYRQRRDYIPLSEMRRTAMANKDATGSRVHAPVLAACPSSWHSHHKVRYYGIWHKSNAYHVSTLANSMILASIMSGRPIRQSENEDSPVTDKTLKCPHCGSDQLVLLEQLPRPRSRGP